MMNDGSCVENVEWGKTAVRLDNRLKVNKSLLRQIVEEADIGKCRMLLVCDKNNGFQSLDGTPRGIAFAEKDLDILDIAVPDNKSYIGHHNIDARNEWDYAVYLPHISAQTWKKHKPYFVYALGHELTHIWIMSQDLNFHRFTSWLFFTFCEGVVECKLKKYEVPWEKYCNKKGKCIALNIDDEWKVRDGLCEYAKFLRNYNDEHSKVVEWLCKLDCSDVNVENILSIKNATRALCCGQWKRPLFQYWEKERAKGMKLAQRFELPDFI